MAGDTQLKKLMILTVISFAQKWAEFILFILIFIILMHCSETP